MKNQEQPSANGKSKQVVNHGITEQPETITPEKIEMMDYLFKEVDLDNEDDFKELGREFSE